MGTNFYFGMSREEAGVHIGKRSAAGLYCWDCGVSLCNQSRDMWNGKYLYGHDAIHYSNSDENWIDYCPICGNKPIEESMKNSTGGRELGFNKNKPQRKTGVATCSSFTWAVSPKRFVDLMKSKAPIYDEYGEFYTRKDFREVLSECPIKFYKSVGIVFS